MTPSNTSGCSATMKCDPLRPPASSSAKKATTRSRGGTVPVRARWRTLASIIASMSFMSTAPRPQMQPSRSSPANGSTDQSAALAGTTSRWPCTHRAAAVPVGAGDPHDDADPPRVALERLRLEPDLAQLADDVGRRLAPRPARCRRRSCSCRSGSAPGRSGRPRPRAARGVGHADHPRCCRARVLHGRPSCVGAGPISVPGRVACNVPGPQGGLPRAARHHSSGWRNWQTR